MADCTSLRVCLMILKENLSLIFYRVPVVHNIMEEKQIKEE